MGLNGDQNMLSSETIFLLSNTRCYWHGTQQAGFRKILIRIYNKNRIQKTGIIALLYRPGVCEFSA